MSAIGFRGGAPSEAAEIVIVSSGPYEFLLRNTRGRVPRPAGGFTNQTCFKRMATARKIGNVALLALFKPVPR